jgi:hypothetical protein
MKRNCLHLINFPRWPILDALSYGIEWNWGTGPWFELRHVRGHSQNTSGNKTWMHFCLANGDEHGPVKCGRGWETSHLDLNFVASWGGIENTVARVGRGEIRHLFMGYLSITQRRLPRGSALPIQHSNQTKACSDFIINWLILAFLTTSFQLHILCNVNCNMSMNDEIWRIEAIMICFNELSRIYEISILKPTEALRQDNRSLWHELNPRFPERWRQNPRWVGIFQ